MIWRWSGRSEETRGGAAKSARSLYMNNALTVSDLAAIRLAMTEYDCAHFGLRIVDADRPFAEPDGSFKSYVLHVADLNINSPHAAVASTFGLRPEDYKPEWES